MMKRVLLLLLVTIVATTVMAQDYAKAIRNYVSKDYKLMFHEAGNGIAYPFITPGSDSYLDCLWDWDSWLTNVGLRQILNDFGSEKDRANAVRYEQGCIENFLDYSTHEGWMPITIARGSSPAAVKPADPFTVNMHKPCLAQHAAFLVQQTGETEWLREKFSKLQKFMNGYRTRQFHRPTGLYFWINDQMIGVDNDPSTYYRPERSSANIYLNTMMYKELCAMAFLANALSLHELAKQYDEWAEKLKLAIREHCWDEWTGFYYSVDINLVERNNLSPAFHQGAQREWNCIIQRIGIWNGFMAMWAGIATPEQAERMVVEHYRNTKTFNCPSGIRTLSPMEKMYNLRASGNPSSWLGPVWGISNYMTWRGLVDYGFNEDARELAERTISLFGRDIIRSGAMHEYYQPDNGEPIMNRGFQNWNMLVLNMLDWYEGKTVIREF